MTDDDVLLLRELARDSHFDAARISAIATWDGDRQLFAALRLLLLDARGGMRSAIFMPTAASTSRVAHPA